MSNASETGKQPTRDELWRAEMAKPSEERNPWPDLCVMRTRYILSAFGMEKEVTRAEWIKAERGAGFRPSGTDNPNVCATGGFSSYSGVDGRIEHVYVVGSFEVRFDRDLLEWGIHSPDGTVVMFPFRQGENSLLKAIEQANSMIPKM